MCTSLLQIVIVITVYSPGCCCCSAYLSSCHRTASDANLLYDPHTFHYKDYFAIGGIRTCLGVSDDPMFLWISSNSCPLNLLLVRSHQAEIIIVKRVIQERNNVTRVRVEPRPFDQGRRRNDASTHSDTLPTLPIRPRHVVLARRQRTDLAVFESFCYLHICLSHTVEASHFPVLILNVE